MILYKCVISGDEMFSDTFKMKEVHDALYEVEAKAVGDGTAATDGRHNVNLANAHRYEGFSIPKLKDFTVLLTEYFKATSKYQEEKAQKEGTDFDRKAFQASNSKAVKDFLAPMFKEIHFYTGESINPSGTLPMLIWKKKEGTDKLTPFFYYFKCGLTTEII